MVKVYAVALAIGVTGLLVVIFGSALAENLRRPDLDPGETIGLLGKSVIGALVGFGMGGLSAEFSPLDLTWPIALLLALAAAGLSVVWVRYSVTRTGA
jgi:hypothetical protein